MERPGQATLYQSMADPEPKPSRRSEPTRALGEADDVRLYLEAAARGEASEAWHRLVDAVAENDPDRIAAAARGVMAFGETSGSDMLAGFVLAAEALP